MSRDIIIGFDAGFRNFGLSITDVTSGKFEFLKLSVIRTEKQTKKFSIKVMTDDALSVATTQNGIREAIDEVCHVDDRLLIVAELPTGGALSAAAGKAMGMASAMAVSFATLFEIPAIWITPFDVKKVVTGKGNGTKLEVMCKIVKKYGGKFKHKSGTKERYTFTLNGIDYTDKVFEHIADSIGAVLYAMKTEQYKLWRR